MRSTRTSLARVSVPRVLLLCGLACVVAACGKKEAPRPLRPRMKQRPLRSKDRSTSSRGPATSSAARRDKNYDWVTKFEADTGCKVNVKTAGTSDEMVSLMTQGGYDLVTASGDASLRLIRGGTVQPVDISKVPRTTASTRA